jgi:hypothetical protein
VHGNAQRALLFTTRQLRTVDYLFDVRGFIRQQLAVNVCGLRCADDSDEQQARKRDRPQPHGVWVSFSSALESFRHVSFRIAAYQGDRLSTGRTRKTKKESPLLFGLQDKAKAATEVTALEA